MNFYAIIKKTAFYSLLLLSCSFWATCRPEEPEQETVINGHLVDAKTGKSVAGAYIDYRVYYMKDNMGFGDNGAIYPDTSGKFTIRYVGDKNLNPFNVNASGYLTKIRMDTPIINGEVNNVKIKMIPTDATIKIVFANINGVNNKVYANFYTPTIYRELSLKDYNYFALPLNNRDSTVKYIYLPSEENVFIAWDTKEFLRNKPEYASIKDTIFLAKKDTLVYKILF